MIFRKEKEEFGNQKKQKAGTAEGLNQEGRKNKVMPAPNPLQVKIDGIRINAF
jgi:hypothetical protein